MILCVNCIVHENQNGCFATYLGSNQEGQANFAISLKHNYVIYLFGKFDKNLSLSSIVYEATGIITHNIESVFRINNLLILNTDQFFYESYLKKFNDKKQLIVYNSEDDEFKIMKQNPVVLTNSIYIYTNILAKYDRQYNLLPYDLIADIADIGDYNFVLEIP